MNARITCFFSSFDRNRTKVRCQRRRGQVRRYRPVAVLLIGLLSVGIMYGGQLFFEAEAFTPSSNGWRPVASKQGSALQALHGASGDIHGTASQRISITTADRYRVWVRYYSRSDYNGPFRLSLQSEGEEVSGKVFDLVPHASGVHRNFVWDYWDADLTAGEYDLVLSKHENVNVNWRMRLVDCVLLTPVSDTIPDHRDYGPQTYMRVQMGPGYTEGVYAHIFADHYRRPWFGHHHLSKHGMGNGVKAPPVEARLLSGEQTPWCNITRILYQDSGALLHVSINHTYHRRPEQMVARFEFATAPDDAAVVRMMEMESESNGLTVAVPPNLVTEENRSRLERDLDVAERIGKLADAYDWPTIGRKPTRFPFFVNVGRFESSVDQAVVDREMRTLDYFGFSNWSRTMLRGARTWRMINGSYCSPDTNRILTAAAQQAERLADAGKTPADVVYNMLTDEPGGQSLDFMAADDAYQTAFRDWIKNRLNLTPSDLLVDTWDEVRTVTADKQDALPALYYFSQRFRTRALGDFMAFQRHALEEACGGSFPVNVNFSDGATYHANFYSQGVDYFELLDDDGLNAIWGEDWANGSSSYQCGAYNVDLMRAAARERGQHIGHLVVAYSGRRPLDVKLKIAGNVARGAKVLSSFFYGPLWTGHEGGPPWSSSAWQNKPGQWGAHAEALREIGGAEDLLMDASAPPAKTAILYSSSSDIWQTSATPDFNFSYGFERMHTWMALTHAQIPVDFLSERQVERGALNGYRVCYVSGPNLTRAAATRLAAWVQAGGTLVVTAGAAARDEYNRSMATCENVLPAKRDDLLTLQRFAGSGRYLRSLASKGRVTVGNAEMDVLSVQQSLTPRPGTTIRGTFEDGTPAWVDGAVGRGRVHCLGFLPALDYIRQAILARNRLVAQTEAEDQVGIDGADDDVGEVLESVAAEDRRRLEQSLNPWDFPSAVREAMLVPVREAAIDPPVICSAPVVDAVYMISPQGVVIPLANYTLHPLTNVNFSVHVDRPVSRVETIHQGQIPFKVQGNRVSLTMPLDSTDYIKLYYADGL